MKTQTKLLYMTDMETYTCQSKILEIYKRDDKHVIVLDQTVFCPQGGGQPFDVGYIKKEDTIFSVEEVRYEEGNVLHASQFESGELVVGDRVEASVDVERRLLNTRLHSAGHVIDLAINQLELQWKPLKGFHFPEGPYVEYSVGDLDISTEELKKIIEDKSNEIINENLKTRIAFNDSEHSSGKPSRIVYFGSFAVPCGGTHVANLKDIEHVTIRKIKLKKGRLKISYI